MSTPPSRQSRKRLATRTAISNAATHLFMEHGFDHVTVDEIADAADVGRMTVFNHFPRKEDMFFDRDEEGRATLRQTLLERARGEAPVEALRRLLHRLVDSETPYLQFTPATRRFIATVEGSAALQARARAIRDELGDVVAAALAECTAQAPGDPAARLAAAMFVTVLGVALVEAHRHFRDGQDTDTARKLFLDLVDRGCAGVQATLAGTPYA